MFRNDLDTVDEQWVMCYRFYGSDRSVLTEGLYKMQDCLYLVVFFDTAWSSALSNLYFTSWNMKQMTFSTLFVAFLSSVHWNPG